MKMAEISLWSCEVPAEKALFKSVEDLCTSDFLISNLPNGKQVSEPCEFLHWGFLNNLGVDSYNLVEGGKSFLFPYFVISDGVATTAIPVKPLSLLTWKDLDLVAEYVPLDEKLVNIRGLHDTPCSAIMFTVSKGWDLNRNSLTKQHSKEVN